MLRRYDVITIAQLHSSKPEFRFCAGENPARSVSEICNPEYLWQWSRMEIRTNPLRRSTILQKQFITIIHHHNGTISFAVPKNQPTRICPKVNKIQEYYFWMLFIHCKTEKSFLLVDEIYMSNLEI